MKPPWKGLAFKERTRKVIQREAEWKSELRRPFRGLGPESDTHQSLHERSSWLSGDGNF